MNYLKLSELLKNLQKDIKIIRILLIPQETFYNQFQVQLKSSKSIPLSQKNIKMILKLIDFKNISKFKRMSDVFPLFEKTKEIQYDPALFSNNLGQVCDKCDKKLVYHESITPCQCYSYCHDKCLTRQINKLNKQKRQCIIRCLVCKRKILFQEWNSFEFGLSCKIHNIIPFIVCVLGMLAICISWKVVITEMNIPILLALTILAGIFTAFGIIFFVNLISKRLTNITSTRSTALQLKISAFQKMSDFTEELEEATQTEMVTRKK